MRIAIVGAGVSGLVAAHLLHRHHELTIFEAADYVGGHTHTVAVNDDGRSLNVDTGFIVFNPAAYPNFVKLLAQLGVESQPSDMSFSVSCQRSGLEYAGTNLNTLFAQRRNLLKPSFHRMIQDIRRFNRETRAVLRDDRAAGTLRHFLAAGRYSQNFIDHYVVPMGAAVWSADPARFDEVPLRFFVQFFDNHGMLAEFERPTWRVVRGGSRTYVNRIVAPLENRIRLNTRVATVRRGADGVDVTTADGTERFDQLVLALHSDQALRLLADPSPAEREILGAIPFQPNETVLHTDTSLLPRARRAWASWNYRIPRTVAAGVQASYYMNTLQRLESAKHYVVSLNQTPEIAPDRIIGRYAYEHPVFRTESVAAQERHSEISGVNRTHYCGAYWGYGFHEDGVRSGVRVAAAFGISW